MFYDDYDLDYTPNNDIGMDLDEMCEHYTSYNMQDTYELDEEYGRDTYDYNELHIDIMHDIMYTHTRISCTTNAR